MKANTELLAPAGNLKCFFAACNSGANAIYMGVEKFNARAMAKNFTIDEYIECIKYAHKLGIKVFLTLNTLLNDDDVKEALKLILELYQAGLDAIILQDLGLAKKVKEIFPDLDMHASTQLSVYSLEQVKLLEKIGFKRVVLARELTLKEIEYICNNTDLEIEVFVHGALCVSLSGQCLMSYAIGNRSANKGQCAQPCRMRYTLVNKTLAKEIQNNKYLLSKKDIWGLNQVSRLKAAGVYSFKIEGRNRTPEYVAITTEKYRKALDEKEINVLEKKELKQMFIRQDKSEGFFTGVEYKKAITDISPKNTGIILGEVEDQKGPYIKVKLRETINLHDGFEIYDLTQGKNELLYSSIITCIKDNNNKILNSNNKIQVSEYAWIGDVNKKIKFGSVVYKTSDSMLNRKYSNLEKQKPSFNVAITIKSDEKLIAKSSVFGTEVSTIIDYIPEQAKTVCISKDVVKNNFNKTLDYEIKFENIEIFMSENLYIPIAKINELRKTHASNIVEALNNHLELNLLDRKRRANEIKKFLENDDTFNIKKLKSIENKNTAKSLFIYKFDEKKDYDIKNYNRIYVTIQDIMRKKDAIFNTFFNNEKKLFICIPNFILKNVSKYIKENLENLVNNKIGGFLIGSFQFYEECIRLKEKYNIKLIADYSFNISNIYSAQLFKSLGFDIIAPSVEIDDYESISSIIDIEIITCYITVMTSRYCLIGAFDQNRMTYKDKCLKPCLNNEFVLVDSHNAEYNIITDHFDCIMRIIKPIDKFYKEDSLNSIRKCII